jgi:hypothetical protein
VVGLEIPTRLPLSAGHQGTARNAAGHVVVDVAGSPERCWGLGFGLARAHGEVGFGAHVGAERDCEDAPAVLLERVERAVGVQPA